MTEGTPKLRRVWPSQGGTRRRANAATTSEELAPKDELGAETRPVRASGDPKVASETRSVQVLHLA